MYKIRLQDFEGPLDLLLFFIKRDEIDIYDIPISHITKEFFDYIHIMQKLDLEVAGDFILMASTLMQIKVRMLLPREVNEKGEEIDPREDLVKALLEYKQYKEMSEELTFFENNQRKLFFRNNFSEDETEAPPEFDTLLKNITVYDLIKCFKNVLAQKQQMVVHEIKKVNITIDEQAAFILSSIEETGEVTFLKLVEDMNEKIRIVVTFVAMLEMIKMQKIGLRESPNFNDFVIYRLEETSGEDLQFDY
ncbi:MAG: ScpA family protein [Rhodothermaceae bacterium]